LCITTPGGGGYGLAGERDTAALESDRRNDKIASAEIAGAKSEVPQ
jgi:N-methylhydantoinase B/oxoprolinase/acetone carboxylase alpha subunit